LNLAGSYGYAYDGNYPALRDCIDPDFQATFEKTLETRFGKTLQDLAKAKKIGIVLADITDRLNPKVAEVNGDIMLYAASLPKIAIVLGVFVEMERGKMKLDNEYIIVALVEHEKGGEVLVDLITTVEELMDQRNR
jgi:beta-lactamase class A